MIIMDGKSLANEIKSILKTYITKRISDNIPYIPTLKVITVGGNGLASESYLRGKIKDCADVGINFNHVNLGSTSTTYDVIDAINKNDNADGIIIQLPLPNSLDKNAILAAIPVDKDVDGCSDVNMGRLLKGKPSFSPCTPFAVIELLKKYDIELKGKTCVVLGRSIHVGKPLAVNLINEGATVVVCNSNTSRLEDITLQADILISAVGKPALITGDMVKQGVIAIDVGINHINGKICGDIEWDSVSQKASFITPIPGGVGLVTRAILLRNTVKAWEQHYDLYSDLKR